MLFTLIGFLILLVGCINFKNGFYLFLFYKMVLVTNITLISVPGIPLLTLEVFMTLAFFCLYYRNRRSPYLEKVPFPYVKPFLWLACSYFFSTVFAIVGFSAAISAYIGDIICNYGFAWLMWKVINRKDIQYLLKGFAIVFVLSCVYGFYEKNLLYNPIILYEQTLNTDVSRVIDYVHDYDVDNYRGYRVQSFFEHPIGCGCLWALYVAFTFTMLNVYRIKIPHSTKTLMLLAALMCIPCLFFSNSRSPIVFLFVSILSVVNLKDYRFYLRLAIAICVILLVAPFFSDYANNVLSIFDSKAQEKVGGSDAEMRFGQLAASIELVEKSPIVGLGYKFTNVMHTHLVEELLGMESMWFRVLTQFGLLGVVANIVYAYFSLVKIPKRYHSQPLFFMSLAYWTVYSMTSVPGLKFHFYSFALIVFIKMSQTYENS